MVTVSRIPGAAEARASNALAIGPIRVIFGTPSWRRRYSSRASGRLMARAWIPGWTSVARIGVARARGGPPARGIRSCRWRALVGLAELPG